MHLLVQQMAVGGSASIRKRPKRWSIKLRTSPKDLKCNDPSLLLVCVRASLGRIASSAYIVTCRKDFAA